MQHYSADELTLDKRYLSLLSKEFPSIQSVATELINLEAILNLPKGTEHFLSDLHGEDDAFLHLVKSGSGVIRKKIDDVFMSTITTKEKNDLANLVYYPKEVLKQLTLSHQDINDFYTVTLHRLVLLCKEVSTKYTRSKVRKSLPREYSYIIEELLHERGNEEDKYLYYDQIIQSIIEINQAKNFIVEISKVIQRLAIDRLHIVGDVYDRGNGPHRIMDKIMEYHSVDFQWGNHDVLWMGASIGSLICIASVLRICARYGNFDLLDEGYGINLLPLGKFALDTYDEYDACFIPKNASELSSDEVDLHSKMHQAISIIQFKLEGQLVKRNPAFGLEKRLLLDKVNDSMIEIDGVSYNLETKGFKTVDASHPYQLTKEEEDLMLKLRGIFTSSERLKKHMDFLFNKGSMYTVFNQNLLFHACVPLKENGDFQTIELEGQVLFGKSLYEFLENKVRESYVFKKQYMDQLLDYYWFLWSSKFSPLYGRDEMKTFERYFIQDKSAHVEKNNPYYDYIKEHVIVDRILKEFDCSYENSRIINGHLPVKVKSGESPLKADGRVISIDGGLSKSYQDVTGIAGYTLIFNSNGMLLAAHQPFNSKFDAIKDSVHIGSELINVYDVSRRLRVKDTDVGLSIQNDIDSLCRLLSAYQLGIVSEH